MDLTSINSLNNYIKSMDMQQKWQQKKKTGSFSPDKKAPDEWIEEQKKKLSENPDAETKRKDKTLTGIMTKLSSGRRLTPAEMRYLQVKDPASYIKAQSVESERAAYERQLKTCRTKDDVHRYKMAHAASALSAVNAAMNDPHMSAEEKFEAVMHIKHKMNAVEKETVKFVKSGDYAALPSDRERIKAHKDMERAKKEERRCREANKQAEIQPRKEKRKYRKKEKPKYTTQQAQNTREARKVRRACAKAAYEESRNAMISMITSSSKNVDVKA